MSCRHSSCAVACTEVDAGGVQNVAWTLQLQHQHPTLPALRFGVMVAGNSGRPGGFVRSLTGTVDPNRVHAKHKTQEEAVVSAWLAAQTGGGGDHRDLDDVFCSSISGAWGMCDPSGSSPDTIQCVNYITTRNERAYADAYVVKGAALCTVDKGVFNLRQCYRADLVFVSGPNRGAMCEGGATSSTTRTLNTLSKTDYTFFRLGVKAAVRAGLDAMVAAGVDVALVAQVSCGIYAGDWTCLRRSCCPEVVGRNRPPHCPRQQSFRHRIRGEFVRFVNEVLEEKILCVHATRHRRGCYFHRVVIPILRPGDL
jgi:hypothetical protein